MKARDIGRPTIVGTPSEAAAVVAEYEAAGVDEVIIPDFTFRSPEERKATLDSFAEGVISQF